MCRSEGEKEGEGEEEIAFHFLTDCCSWVEWGDSQSNLFDLSGVWRCIGGERRTWAGGGPRMGDGGLASINFFLSGDESNAHSQTFSFRYTVPLK
jgi:hypothetical protein